MDVGDMVRCLNQELGGWTNYFKLGPVSLPSAFPVSGLVELLVKDVLLIP